MGTAWTTRQRQVIDLRGRNLLVSAAAGSGKTAVLVERIIKKVLDSEHPVDIDRLLVVTFTKAAAAEMRERVAHAIEARIAGDPGNAYLHRQHTLVHHAQITTIDSFCLYVVKNYFQCIGLSPGFRVGDPGELALLSQEVMEEVMERWYDGADPDFIAFADDYATAKNDSAIMMMVQRLYDYSESHPWPAEWLEGLGDIYSKDALARAPEERAGWFGELTDYIHAAIEGGRARLERARRLCLSPGGPDMYLDNIEYVLSQMAGLEKISDFDALGAAIRAIDFGRLGVRRGFDGDKAMQELVKKIRKSVRDGLEKLQKEYFSRPLASRMEDMAYTGRAVRVLARLTTDFAASFRKKKDEEGILDFSDIEHMALRILVDEKTKEPTAVAWEFRELFEEVMIDEYQDSNYVQEAILTAVSGGGRDNLFMVGDVKQSIYRFRLARPELFMEKYGEYTLEDSPCQKICLERNFRSRAEVLDAVNDLFYRVMRRDIGGVEYDGEAALYPGAEYPAAGEGEYRARILIADAGEDALAQSGADNAAQAEAAMIAEEILSIKASQKIADGEGGMRDMRYSDIVILLRSPNSWGAQLEEQLSLRGIPSHRMAQTGYFSAPEVQAVLSLCKAIDNPLQDIPLAAVLLGMFFGFSDEELALVRANGGGAFLYNDVEGYAQSGQNDALREKCGSFLERLADYRGRARTMPVHDLIGGILRESGYLNYIRALPAGEKRLANVEMLLGHAANFERAGYKGLFSFIRYMEQLDRYEVDFGEADVSGEHDDVVRIMSIHKSKGLEFPVVFVSGLGRRFNKQDSTDVMVLDHEYGVGLSCIERKKHRKCTTLLRQTIAGRVAGENIGEEMRVLYVAMTRAREQLILTGAVRGLEELYDYELQASDEAAYLDRREAGCFLDWVLPGAYAHPEHFSIETYGAGESRLTGQMREAERYIGKERLADAAASADPYIIKQIDDRLCFAYPYEHELQLRSKISVSEIKHRNMILEPGDEEALAWYAADTREHYVPRFVGGDAGGGPHKGALRGTAMHRMMECLDYGAAAGSGISRGEVARQLAELGVSGRIDAASAELVDLDKIWHFLQTELAGRIIRANGRGKLYREQPFVMGIPAYEAEPGVDSAELVLVQGIIDLYFEEEGGIVLLDYKTDSVKNARQLLDRYQTQLDLYARALSSATGRPVTEKLIYSFKLEEVISC